MTRRPTTDQKEFNWTRADQLFWLEQYPGNDRVKSLLKAIDCLARENRTVEATLRRIAHIIGVSIKTARRHVKEAVAADLLSVERTNKSASTYGIIWQNLRNASPPPPTRRRTPSQNGSPPLPNWEPPPSQFGRGATAPNQYTNNSRPNSLGNSSRGERQPEQIGSILVKCSQTKSKSWHGTIEPQHLINRDELLRLATAAADAGHVDSGRQGQIVVFAAARVALHARDVKSPAGLFIAIVENRNKTRDVRLGAEDYARARQVLSQQLQDA